MPWDNARLEIAKLGLKLMYPVMLDTFQDYYYTTAPGWADVFNYIYCGWSMPDFVAARMDCEDFAILLKALVSALFGLNFFGICGGTIPQGGHAFNLFWTDEGPLLLEPQTANFFEIGEHGYKPEYILI